MLKWLKNIFLKIAGHGTDEMSEQIEKALDKCLREGYATCEEPAPSVSFKRLDESDGPFRLVSVYAVDSLKSRYHRMGTATTSQFSGRFPTVRELIESGFKKLKEEEEILRSWGFIPHASLYSVKIDGEKFLLNDYQAEYSHYVLPHDGRKKIGKIMEEDLMFIRSTPFNLQMDMDWHMFMDREGKGRPERELCVALQCGGKTAVVWSNEDPLPVTLSFIADSFMPYVEHLPEETRMLIIESELMDLKPYIKVK